MNKQKKVQRGYRIIMKAQIFYIFYIYMFSSVNKTLCEAP